MNGVKSRFRIKSIQTRLFFVFTILITIVVVAVSLSLYVSQRKMLFNQAREKAFGLTRTLAYSSLNAILEDEYITLQYLIDSMSDSRDLRSIRIIDTTGTVIAADQPRLRGTRLDDELTRRASGTETFLLQKDAEGPEDDLWDTAVPIYNLDQRIGTARIKFTVEDTFSGLQETVLLIGLMAVAVSLVFAYFLARTFSRPIHQAIGLAGEYGKGNLDATLDLRRADEVGQLVNSLNLLSEKLKTVIAEKVTAENLALIGEFSAYIMHDLKNPITGISLLAQGIDENVSERDPLKEYTTELLLSARKIESFLKTLLSLSRPDELFPEVVDLNALLKNLIVPFRQNGIEIVTRFDETIPELKIDRQLFSRAMANLLQNAVDAIPGEGRITISTWQSDSMIHSSVEDTGIGIPEDKRESVFRPFFTGKESGHGLGLTMVKRTVIAHNGEIRLESEPGKFTRFTLSLPKPH